MMAINKLAQVLADATLRNELNTALWMDSFLKDGFVDQGWNCRDHAWTTALLACCSGSGGYVIHGEASFIWRGTNEPVPFRVVQHSWTAIDGIGFVDLSLKPAVRLRSGEDLPLSPVVGNSFLSSGHGTVHITNDENEYRDTINSHLRSMPECGEVASLYLAREIDTPLRSYVTDAPAFINSPLTDHLKETYGHAPYAGLVLHLRDVAGGRCQPCGEQGPERIWSRIIEVYADATEAVLSLSGVPDGLPSD